MLDFKISFFCCDAFPLFIWSCPFQRFCTTTLEVTFPAINTYIEKNSEQDRKIYSWDPVGDQVQVQTTFCKAHSKKNHSHIHPFCSNHAWASAHKIIHTDTLHKMFLRFCRTIQQHTFQYMGFLPQNCNVFCLCRREVYSALVEICMAFHVYFTGGVSTDNTDHCAGYDTHDDKALNGKISRNSTARNMFACHQLCCEDQDCCEGASFDDDTLNCLLYFKVTSVPTKAGIKSITRKSECVSFFLQWATN